MMSKLGINLKAKIFLVGAGGIGCEVLKNLVLTGFEDIVVIDLDTIDVSNLNRQFLFQKQHVGKPKSIVAKESALKYNPSANIQAIHDSILNPDYNLEYYKKFSVVLNALDNKKARSHVNRMCLAAKVPLLESGSAGYLGQSTLIVFGQTECYECTPKPTQKTFPSCTIRNTPSEPIHCVVWSKHLFNQIFGEPDIDEEVSPDREDPGTNGSLNNEAKAPNEGEIKRMSTRTWALDCNYDSFKLFDKLFKEDILYLLSMEHLWKDRIQPKPLDWNNLPDAVAGSSLQEKAAIKDQQIWSIKECANIFQQSLSNIRNKALKLSEGDHLVWDKDDEDCMDFVAACANIRAFCFSISQKSRFDIKSMAGNIIPAIATTNAIIAGFIVLQLLKVLKGKFDQCKTLYLNKQPNPYKKLIVPCVLDKPNPKCYVCSPKSEISLSLNLDKTTIRTLDEKILKKELNMIAPDVEVADGKGTILVSSEGDTDDNLEKTLSSFNLKSGSCLRCDDFNQNFTVDIYLIHKEKLRDDLDFEIIGDISALQPTAEENEVPSPSPEPESKKRKHSLSDEETQSSKKVCDFVEAI